MKKHLLPLFFAVTVFVQAQNISVLTYNIRLNTESDLENRWDNRKDFLSSQIAFYEPDVFGIQEALPEQVSFLADKLPAYSFVSKGRDEGGQGEASSVFLKRPLSFRKFRNLLAFRNPGTIFQRLGCCTAQNLYLRIAAGQNFRQALLGFQYPSGPYW